MKLRRFSQLGWHGCMDLVAAAAGYHVERVELGEAPPKPEPAPATEPCEICKELFPPRELDCEPYGRICEPCYWSLHNS